ncbi:MAG TPA: hypothetical protein VFM20_01810 [Nitrososphaeraceae archaeon]|nr:hypothetical protein [Nitrososphaeraceae archaeon]
MSNDNSDVSKKRFLSSATCALCGRIATLSRSIEETVDGDRYLFDSQNCITIFRKLTNLYGQEFKSISVREEYDYDTNLKTYVLREQELDVSKKEIEKIENQDFQIIRDPTEVQELAFKLAWSTENEILGVFSTSNAFHRQERMGILSKLQQLKKNNDKLRIRILTPFDNQIDSISKRMKVESDINIMNLDESSRIKASFLLVDRKFVLFVGLKDDTKTNSCEAIGASMFSSIRSTVISYVTIFEIMWRQQELYQQLSNFRQRIETYELINKQLNDTIVDLKHRLDF